MILDILILAILGVTIFFSMRKGFTMALTGFFRGLVSIVLAWIFCDDLSAYLVEKTSLGAAISAKLEGLMTSRWESSDFYQSLPELLREGDMDLAQGTIATGAAYMADLVLTILSFVLIVIGIQLAASLLTRLLSHRFRGGFIGFVDYLFGVLIGIFLGAFNVLLMLALIPVIALIFPSLGELLAGWLETAYLAKDLYDNNLLLVLLQTFLV